MQSASFTGTPIVYFFHIASHSGTRILALLIQPLTPRHQCSACSRPASQTGTHQCLAGFHPASHARTPIIAFLHSASHTGKPTLAFFHVASQTGTPILALFHPSSHTGTSSSVLSSGQPRWDTYLSFSSPSQTDRDIDLKLVADFRLEFLDCVIVLAVTRRS